MQRKGTHRLEVSVGPFAAWPCSEPLVMFQHGALQHHKQHQINSNLSCCNCQVLFLLFGQINKQLDLFCFFYQSFLHLLSLPKPSSGAPGCDFCSHQQAGDASGGHRLVSARLGHPRVQNCPLPVPGMGQVTALPRCGAWRGQQRKAEQPWLRGLGCSRSSCVSASKHTSL